MNPFKKERALKIVELRNKKLTWGQIGIKLKIDRNNARRAYLKFNQSNSDNLAQQGVTR